MAAWKKPQIFPPGVILAILLLPISVHGTIVNTIADEDDGSLGGGAGISLREAVSYSAAGVTITFDPTLSGQTIRLSGGQIVISKTLTIDGSALPVKITLSGDKTGDGKTADDSRVFRINSGTVAIDSLIITGGYISGTATGLQGGGIYISSGNCNFTRSIISGNCSQYEGGGIYNQGTLTIQQCEISGNSAIRAGAIFNSGFTTSILIENSTISGNTAAGDAGGIWNMSGNVNLRTSSLINNSADFAGGAIDNDGIFFIDRSTFQGNSAKFSGGGINNNGNLTLRNSTVSENTSDTAGGGIYKESGSMVINYVIVVGNHAPGTPNISGTFTSSSNNLTSGDPLLAPLGNYGGPTQTMPPLPGSPAINGGGTATNDQRGLPRVGVPDIGAVEYQGAADLARFWKLDFDGDGSPFGTEQALGTDPLLSDPASTRNLTAPTFNTSGHAVLSFGIAPAALGTRWILRRSNDLLTFTEIYRTDGTTDTAAPGVTFLRTASEITVTDTTAPPGGAFYRFEALLEP